MRYIDADKAKEKLGVVRGAYSCFLEEDRPYYHVLSETIKMINEMPTAVYDCERGLLGVMQDDYCSYGERAENENNS